MNNEDKNSNNQIIEKSEKPPNKTVTENDVHCLKENEDNKSNKNIEDENKKRVNYIEEIKNYLKPESFNKEYFNMINNEPEKLFDAITDRTIIFWQSVVFSYEATFVDSDADILTVIPEREDQTVIKNDCHRTRFKESSLIPGFKKILEEVITFYCNIKKIDYKQGLNEIFGPLILIKYKLKYLKLTNIFNFGEAFIDKYLPNYYYEKELYSLKSSISLFVLLLKYHEPSVFNYLDSIEIPHELYATNWLITLRAQKLNLDILYIFWDNLIKINDPLFIHFFLVALIKYKRELLINCDSNLLLKLMVALTINSKKDLDEVIKIALELRKKTPYSFRLLANKIGFLKVNNKNVKKNFDKYNPESILTMPVFPSEILHQNYKSQIICPDPECPNNRKIRNDSKLNNINDEINDNRDYICERCNISIQKDINYVLIDLRLFTPSYFKDDDEYFKMGFVSGMLAVDKEELKLDNIDKLLSSRFFSTRGKNHIVLMTSTTDYFFDFEQKYYSDSRSELMKKKILFGVIEQEKQEKILNLENAEKNLDLKEIYKLKEYDNLRKIIIEMKKNNFPYVSYLEGGFEELHRESFNYNVELFDHSKKKCKLCQKIKKKETLEEKKYRKLNSVDKISNINNTLWKNKKIITEKELSSFFTHDKNFVLIGGLHKYKNKYYQKKEIELFLAILYDKKTIEVYKNDLKKTSNKELESYNIDNINYYNLGIKNEEKRDNFILRLFEEIHFEDIKTLNDDIKYKNTIILEIVRKDKSDHQHKINESYEIGFDFFSNEDSETFKIIINDIIK